MIIKKSGETYWARIYIAGPIHKAEDICRELAEPGGWCINITQNKYIYKHGEETGICAEIISYPRFPETEKEIDDKAMILGLALMNGMHQGSFTIVTPKETILYDRRS